MTETQLNQPERVAASALSTTLLALVAHTLWGSYTVFSRLFLTTYAFPPLVFIAAGQTLASLIGLIISWRYLRWSMLRDPALIALMLASAARGLTNILAINYTLAIYVQLINLLSPFVVALLGTLVFREAPPPNTFRALVVATFGAVTVLVGNPFSFSASWGPTDGLGVGLALVSVLALSLWTQLMRLNTHRNHQPPIVVLTFQSVAIASVGGVSSLFFAQGWEAWGSLPLDGWLLAGGIVVGVLVVGNFLQVLALSRLKASFYSSLMGWRLVVALSGGALLLGEQLRSIWQVAGAVVVIITVTLYMRQGRGDVVDAA